MIPKYLTDLEIDKIEAFCKDEVLFNTIKKVLLASVYHNAVLKKGEDFEHRNPVFNFLSDAYSTERSVSDEEIGQHLRGLFEGVHLVEAKFNELKTIKKETPAVESPYNEAV